MLSPDKSLVSEGTKTGGKFPRFTSHWVYMDLSPFFVPDCKRPAPSAESYLMFCVKTHSPTTLPAFFNWTVICSLYGAPLLPGT